MARRRCGAQVEVETWHTRGGAKGALGKEATVGHTSALSRSQHQARRLKPHDKANATTHSSIMEGLLSMYVCHSNGRSLGLLSLPNLSPVQYGVQWFHLPPPPHRHGERGDMAGESVHPCDPVLEERLDYFARNLTVWCNISPLVAKSKKGRMFDPHWGGRHRIRSWCARCLLRGSSISSSPSCFMRSMVS